MLCAETFGAAEKAEAGETRQALAAAVDTLAVQDREILLRRYYYEQKPKEIALALDIPVKKVENRLYRTKRKLRDLMADEV